MKKEKPVVSMVRAALAQESAAHCAEGAISQEAAVVSLKAALKGANAGEYGAVRFYWIAQYRTLRKTTEDAAAKAFQRLMSEFSIARPKSQKPASVKKQKEREAARAKLAAIPADKLAEQVKAAQKIAARKTATAEQVKEAKTLESEAERRAKEAAREAEARLAGKRKSISGTLEALDYEQLTRVEALIATFKDLPATAPTPKIERILRAA